ncbi:CapA family protein [Spirochaetia bacterium 38H-sp]|uniref:CapA family protein n=1 Tax=Rarispira pelagica TaxID=3141764 RepID=A0ABU9U9B5_9SPIR
MSRKISLIAFFISFSCYSLYSPVDLPLRQLPELAPYVFLTFAGDLMAHNVNYETPNYDEIYKDIKSIISSDDISFCNLETVLQKDKPNSTFPFFSVKPAYVEAAIKAGFDVFSIANNHSCDQGKTGVFSTIDNLMELAKTYKIAFNGAVEDKKDLFVPTEIRIKDISIGFLAVTAFLNAQDGAEYINRKYFYNSKLKKELLEQIKKNRSKYDLFILSVHAGTEYAQKPDKKKADFFKEAILAGVDIIWAHHPHVLQPYKIYIQDNRIKGIVMYSMGNLISGQTWFITPGDYKADRAPTGDSLLLGIKVRKNLQEVEILPARIYPISHYIKGRGVYIKTYRTLLDDNFKQDTKWKEYYKERYNVLLDFWNPEIEYLK